MKKTLLKHLAALKKASMLFAVCAFGANMTAQTIIAESFEDLAPLPPGWTNFFNIGDQYTFVKHSGEASHGNECLRVGTQQNHGPMVGYLSTPPIALTAGQTIKISFDYTVVDIDDNGGEMRVYVDGSKNVNVVGFENYLSKTDFTTSFPYTTLNLTFTAEETKDYYITFYAGASGTIWPNKTMFKFLMDRVIIENNPPCVAPTNIVVTETSSNVVNLDWNTAGTETAWEVQVTNGGLPVEANWIQAAVSQKEVNVTPGGTYSAYVRSKCTGGGYSSFYGPKIFTVSCPGVITAPYTIPFVEKGLPGCWEKSGDTNWAFSTGGDYAARDAGDHSVFEGYTQYAWVDGSYNKSGKKAVLLSPKVNVSGLTTPAVEFYAFSGNNNNGVFNELLVEVSNGTTWQTAATVATTTNGWKFYSIDLAALNITDTAQIRFTVTGNIENEATFYNDILIDDVSFREKTTCLPLTNFTTGVITDASAEVSWDAVNTVNTWDITHVEYGDNFDGTAELTGISNVHTFNGLEASTLYGIYIRSNCGNGTVGEWTGPYYLTTDCSLNVPYYHEAFNAQTDYPKYNNQNPGLPKCWTEASGGDVTNGPSEYGEGDWKATPDAEYSAQYGGFTDSQTVSVPFYGGDKKSWLLSPLVDLSGGVYEVKVKVGVNISAYITTTTTMGSDDKVHMLYSENGTNWNVLKTWSAEDNLGSAYDTSIISLEGITGESVRFAFVTDEGIVVDDIQYRFHVDDLIIREKSICIEAVNLFADGITHESAKLSWKNQGVASSWKVAVVPTGITPTNEWQTVFTNPYPAAGLTANTVYDFYVKSVCGGIETEVITGPFKFKTGCTPIMAPYTETFVEYYEMPECWSFRPLPLDAQLFVINYWNFTTEAKFEASTAGDHTAGGETQYAWLNTSGMSNNESGYLYTPVIDVSALQHPAFQFYLFSKNSIDAAQAHIVAEIYNGTQWIEAARIENYTNNWAEYTIDLSDFAITGPIIGRFKITVNSNGGNPGFNIVLIDDVSFIEMPDCSAPFNLVVTEITDTTAEVTWENSGTSTSWELEYGPKGFTLGEGTIITVNTTPEVTLTELDDNQEYDVYVKALCTEGSAIVGPQIFITDTTSGINDSEITKAILYPNPVTDMLNIESNNTIDTIEVYNIVGQLMKKQSVNSDSATIFVSDLSEGIYMVKAFSGKNVGTYKVIKKQ
ncbi:Fibronectin type III domain protein [compost metagenome]